MNDFYAAQQRGLETALEQSMCAPDDYYFENEENYNSDDGEDY